MMPKMRPDFDDCQMIINYICAKAGEPERKPLAVAVADLGGRLISLTLTPGMNSRGGLFAIKKAYTAAMFVRNTKDMAAHLNNVGADMRDFCDPNLSPLRGGAPIFHEDGDCIGAVGISGWTGEEDHELSLEASAMISKHNNKNREKE